MNWPSVISSAPPIVTMIEVPLSRSTSMVLVPGSAIRAACGTVMCQKMVHEVKPTAWAASFCSAGTPVMPPRNISDR